MENFIIGIVALFISYFIIKSAVKEAIAEKMEPYLKIQTAALKYLAKQAGLTEEEIDKMLLTDKQFEKKYKHSKR